jgi:hypothetical protein
VISPLYGEIRPLGARNKPSLKRRASKDDKVREGKEILAISTDCVSPELVLVDPELARRERARLVERAALDARSQRTTFDAETLRRAVERAGGLDLEPAPKTARWRPSRRLQLMLAGCFFVGMFVNGAVLASVVSGPHKTPGQVAAPTPGGEAAAVRLPRKARVERQVLLTLVRSPARLPAQLLDPASGLARTNLRAACRQAEEARYTCHIRVSGAARGLRLEVRFRPGHGGLQFVKEGLRRPV